MPVDIHRIELVVVRILAVVEGIQVAGNMQVEVVGRPLLKTGER